jgi:hypothetical protein
MAAKGTWTVIFEDKLIIKQSELASGNQPVGHTIDDNDFWNNPDYSNFWAIQYQTSNSSDEVEFKDETPNDTWASTGLDFQPFMDKWEAAHLAYLQGEWDNDNVVDEEGNPAETPEEKIARLGERPS